MLSRYPCVRPAADNRDAHYGSTGPEIWAQTEGKVDAFVCATGTGGTLGGESGADG